MSHPTDTCGRCGEHYNPDELMDCYICHRPVCYNCYEETNSGVRHWNCMQEEAAPHPELEDR